MVLDDATVEQIILRRYVCKTKILCANAVICLKRTHKKEHGRYSPVEDINKILLFHNNCIEHQCLELNLTPQEEQQWNKYGATDIDDKDLVKHDDLIESQEHTHNDADTLILREEETESKEDESQRNSLVSNNKVTCGSMRPLKRVETDSFIAKTLPYPGLRVGGNQKNILTMHKQSRRLFHV